MLNVKKICFIASSGGHFKQLTMLRELMDQFPSFVVTEEVKGAEVPGKQVYYLKQVNRKEGRCLLYMLQNTWRSMKILRKEKPDVVICTGVLATIPLCLMAKLLGKKLIYIESFAKVNTGTLSGKLMYHIADHFLVQWESMLKVYPKAVYKGGLY